MATKPKCSTREEMTQFIDPQRPLKVYRNLNSGCFSVMQDNRVMFHTDAITLYRVQFKVNNSGRLRCLNEKRKNVHAYAIGYLSAVQDKHTDFTQWDHVTYDPYKYDSFVNARLSEPVSRATCARLQDQQLFALATSN